MRGFLLLVLLTVIQLGACHGETIGEAPGDSLETVEYAFLAEDDFTLVEPGALGRNTRLFGGPLNKTQAEDSPLMLLDGDQVYILSFEREHFPYTIEKEKTDEPQWRDRSEVRMVLRAKSGGTFVRRYVWELDNIWEFGRLVGYWARDGVVRLAWSKGYDKLSIFTGTNGGRNFHENLIALESDQLPEFHAESPRSLGITAQSDFQFARVISKADPYEFNIETFLIDWASLEIESPQLVFPEPLQGRCKSGFSWIRDGEGDEYLTFWLLDDSYDRERLWFEREQGSATFSLIENDWLTAAAVELDHPFEFRPRIRTDPWGNLHAVVYVDRNVVYIRSVDGGRTIADMEIFEGDYIETGPALAVFEHNVALAWWDRGLQCRVSHNYGAHFGEPLRINDKYDNYQDVGGSLELEFDRQGRVHLAWMEDRFYVPNWEEGQGFYSDTSGIWQGFLSGHDIFYQSGRIN